MARIETEIGQSLREAAKDVAAAWKAAESGRTVAADDRLVFRDWEARTRC
ncbi:hypothetical protein [Methylobacterium frigidaeris]|nr:hypothetical protein [Methylobacterium frigidaeris]